MQDMQPDNMNPAAHTAADEANHDREGAMAKADLHKLASYSLKLFKKLDDDAQLEGWVQAKITKAADYIASVYHYLEYEMEFSDYGAKLDNNDMYTEDQKLAIKNKLMEAKSKIAELKKTQAEKMKAKDSKKVEEGVLSGGERPCAECGGSGMVYEEPKAIPDHVKSKVEKYNRLTKATHAASKRLDRNNNGIPDNLEDKPVDEEFGGGDKEMKVGDKKKTRTGELTKTSTGVIHKNTSYADDGDAEDKSGKGKKSHAKAQSAAEKKEKAPAQKMSPKSAKTWGMKDSEKFDNRDKAVDENLGQGVYAEGKGKKPDFLDMDKDGDKKEPMKKAVADKKKNPFAKKDSKVEEGSTCNESPKGKSCPVHGMKECSMEESAKQTMSRAAKGHEKYGKEGMAALAKAGKEGKDLDKVRDKYNKYDESAPSAGMTKKEKSATVKDAKAGKDIGKPGKSFDKVAKAAGGGEKGEKIAAAAMWKNKAKAMKESLQALIPEKQLNEEDQAQAQAGLQALLDYAKQNDPQGLAQAVQQGGQAIENYFKDLANKIPATPAQGTATPAAAPATPAAATAPAASAPTTPTPTQASESIETKRMREQLARLTQNENIIVKESNEVDQLRALTKRLLG
jgi:hypothetical protein